MKYYWIQYSIFSDGPTVVHTDTCIAGEHPFEWRKNNNAYILGPDIRIVLGMWKQITVEEYNLYQELNNGTTVSPVPDSHIMD